VKKPAACRIWRFSKKLSPKQNSNAPRVAFCRDSPSRLSCCSGGGACPELVERVSRNPCNEGSRFAPGSTGCQRVQCLSGSAFRLPAEDLCLDSALPACAGASSATGRIRRGERVGDGALAIANLCDLFAPFFQLTRVTPSMKDRQYPNLVFSNNVIDTIELKAMYRRPAHVRKPDSREQG